MASPDLLGLPRELRDRIYDFVYPYDNVHLEWMFWPRREGVAIKHLRTHSGQTEKPRELLALLSVNHQISEEAARIFFGKLSFVGRDRILKVFSHYIRPDQRGLIRSVEVDVDSLDHLPMPIDDLVGDLPNARVVKYVLDDQSVERGKAMVIVAASNTSSSRIETQLEYSFMKIRDGESILTWTYVTETESYVVEEKAWRLTKYEERVINREELWLYLEE